MAAFSAISLAFLPLLTTVVASAAIQRHVNYSCAPVKAKDKDQMKFPLNLEMLEAEYYLNSALGKGLDYFHPEYAEGGPPPIGAQKANLDPQTRRVIEEFGYQEMGHIRAIRETVGGIKRPLYDLRAKTIGGFIERAVGRKLDPPFDPYADPLKFIISVYLIPYIGVNGYVATNPLLKKYKTKKLLVGLMGVEAGQDEWTRATLYRVKDKKVEPYDITVAEFTNAISNLCNKLGRCGIKDEGIWVPPQLGAENMTRSNVISADYNSLSYPRTPREIMRILQGTGSEYKPGGFFPKGGNGKIARMFRRHRRN